MLCKFLLPFYPLVPPPPSPYSLLLARWQLMMEQELVLQSILQYLKPSTCPLQVRVSSKDRRSGRWSWGMDTPPTSALPPTSPHTRALQHDPEPEPVPIFYLLPCPRLIVEPLTNSKVCSAKLTRKGFNFLDTPGLWSSGSHGVRCVYLAIWDVFLIPSSLSPSFVPCLSPPPSHNLKTLPLPFPLSLFFFPPYCFQCLNELCV